MFHLSIDIAEMPYYSYNKEYFIVCIDLFNKMLYTEPIIEKGKKDVFPALTKILNRSKDFEKVTVDGELWWLADYFKQKGKTHVNIKVSFSFT